MTPNLPPKMGFISKGVTIVAVSLLTFMLLTRYLVLSLLPESAFVDEWFASDLFFHFHHAIDVWFLWIAFDLPLLIGLPLLLIVFRRKFFLLEDGRLWLSGPAVTLAWIFLASHHFMLDIQPTIAAALLPLVFCLPNPFKNWELPHIVITSIVSIGYCAAVLYIEPNAMVAVSALGIFLVLAVISHILPSRIGPRLHWVLVIAALAFSQIVLSLGPLVRAPEMAKKLDTHRAYSFCESTHSGAIYAAVTACYLHDSRYLVSEDCKQEHVAEFAPQSLALTKRHELSTPSYYGRMEFVRCVDDTLYVGGSDMVQNGENLLDSTLSMNMRDPGQVIRNLVPAGIGHRSAYDPKRDAMYFSGEFKDTIIRLDRTTGEQDTTVGDWYKHPMLVLFALPIPGSLAFAPESLHPERDALYLGEIFADAAYGFNLEDHSLIQKYQSVGGIIELTVDHEADRLYLANMWGLDVWDLKTQTRIKRMRLGTVNRHPIIDKTNNLIYIPSTVTGRLYVVDRINLQKLGSITTGYGPRYGIITQNGKLIFSANNGTYAFDTQELANQFRDGVKER